MPCLPLEPWLSASSRRLSQARFFTGHAPLCLLQAIANQVDHDLRLMGDRVHKLGGAQGSARLAAALAAVRAAAAPERTLSQDAEPQSPTAAAAGLSRYAAPPHRMQASCRVGLLQVCTPTCQDGCVEARCPASALGLNPTLPQVSKPVSRQEGAAQPGRVHW